MEDIFDDILNIGINDTTVKALAKVCKSERLPLESIRKFSYSFYEFYFRREVYCMTSMH